MNPPSIAKYLTMRPAELESEIKKLNTQIDKLSNEFTTNPEKKLKNLDKLAALKATRNTVADLLESKQRR